jgi:hypothetical protein
MPSGFVALILFATMTAAMTVTTVAHAKSKPAPVANSAHSSAKPQNATPTRDPERARLPRKGKDVSNTHPARATIYTLMNTYVRALEGRDLNLYLSVVTGGFDQNLGLSRRWSTIRTQGHPESIQLEDLLLMNYLGKIFVRFSVKDKRTGKVTRLGARSWYIVVKDSRGKWRIDEFFANFNPDAKS